jgi:hypothetical protein
MDMRASQRVFNAKLPYRPARGYLWSGSRKAIASESAQSAPSSRGVIGKQYNDRADDRDEHRFQAEVKEDILAEQRKQRAATTAPTRPSAMSITQPWPWAPTILLAMKPVISPKKIQPRMDMSVSPKTFLLWFLARKTYRFNGKPQSAQRVGQGGDDRRNDNTFKSFPLRVREFGL